MLFHELKQIMISCANKTNIDWYIFIWSNPGNFTILNNRKVFLINPSLKLWLRSPHFFYLKNFFTGHFGYSFHYGKPVVPIRWVLIRDPQGKFETRALLCTDQTVTPIQILNWFVRRWQVEVTFQEVRAHLGVETQRQWSDLAIARTTPVLLGLFSWVTLLAHQSQTDGKLPIRQAAWYAKSLPTFSDAIALVRSQIWNHWGFWMSSSEPDIQIFQPDLLKRLFDAVCYSTWKVPFGQSPAKEKRIWLSENLPNSSSIG